MAPLREAGIAALQGDCKQRICGEVMSLSASSGAASLSLPPLRGLKKKKREEVFAESRLNKLERQHEFHDCSIGPALSAAAQCGRMEARFCDSLELKRPK